LKRKLVWIQRC